MNKAHLVSILMTAAIAGASPIYDITDLGSLGGSSASAFGLSSTGQVAGAATTTFGYTHAFSNWGTGMIDLTLGAAAPEGSAAAVNAGGQVAGTQYLGGQAQATVWDGGTQAVAVSGTGPGSYAMAINDAGDVAGMFTTDAGQGHAFRTVDGALQDLGALPGGTWSSAYAMNQSGQIAGYGDTGSGGFHAFIWSEGTGYTVLGTLGGANSYAMGINGSGVVAGSAQLASGYIHAIVSSGGSLHDLGTLGGGSSYAYGINSTGSVVGYSSVPGAGPTHAFLVAGGFMLDLNSLIDPASGWLLTQAYAINDSGQIAGSGLFNGVEHAFRLDYRWGFEEASGPFDTSVPEPATLTMVAAGLAVAAALRLRTRLQLRRPLPVQPPTQPGSTVGPTRRGLWSRVLLPADSGNGYRR